MFLIPVSSGESSQKYVQSNFAVIDGDYFDDGVWFENIYRQESKKEFYLAHVFVNRFIVQPIMGRIPVVKLKIPGKSIFEIGNQNFCYIQVIVFDLSHLSVVAYLLSPNRCH